MYDYQTLTLTNIDGSISPFPNGASGLILLGTGTSTPPAWTSLADAGIATKQYVDNTFLPLAGGTLTGDITGTTAAFTGLTLTGAGTGFVKASSGALSVGNITVSDITSGWPTSNNGTGIYITGGANTSATPPSTLVNPSQDGLYVLSFACYGDYGVDNPLTNTTHIGWEKLSPGVVISNEGSTHSKSLITVSTATEGQVLAKTSSGYGFIDVGSSIVPPINQLQCATSGITIANDMFLKAGANPSDNPSWEHITASNIYGATNGVPSVLISQGEGTGTATSTGVWLPTNTLSTTPQILAALSGSNNGLRFYSPSELGVASVAGLSDGVAKISNGALTSGSVALGGSEVSGTLGVAHGGTGLNSLGAAGQLLVVNSGASALGWSDSAPKANTLTTPRTLTIGNTGHTFNGSANVSWSQNEIGFASGQTKSFTFTQTGWYRIAELSAGANKANIIYNNNAHACSGDFSIELSYGRNPQIKQNIYNYASTAYTIEAARIIYKSGMAGYLEVKIATSGAFAINFEIYAFSKFQFLETATTGNDESANGYNVLEYDFSSNAFGSDGQLLKTNRTTTLNNNVANTTYDTISTSWETLPTIPTAPSSLPLVDNETGALGTAGTYANADHQHPLPYAVQAAYKFYYPRKIGIGGAITAEAQEYDGTADLILQVTEIDPHAIINTVPINKGGTGATTASAALTNLGAAATNHNHDSTYLKLSGGTMTGGITFADSVQVPFYWLGTGHTGVAVFGAGEMRLSDDVSNFVKGNTEFKSYYDDSFAQGSGGGYLERVTLAHTNGKNTVYNLAVGDQEPSGATLFTRNIKLPAPSADNLGDELTIIFTNKNSAAIGTINCNCETLSRLVKYDYSIASSLSWGSGNIVKFVCFQAEKNGTTYYWRAVKLVEQSW